MTEDRRRDKWERFKPFNEHLHLLVPEIGDDMDELDQRWNRLERRLAQLVGISTSLLIAVCTGIILAAIGKI